MADAARIIDDVLGANMLYRHVPYRPVGQVIVDEVARQGAEGLYLSTACALVEKEAAGRNIFGCDWGSRWTDEPPYCQVEVTKERVEALIRNYYEPPVGGANGVGYTQLTTMSLVEEAQRLGGAHLPGPNMRVGFAYLLDLIGDYGWPEGAAAYNAGAGNIDDVLHTYGADMARRERQWHERLKGATVSPGVEPEEGDVDNAKNFDKGVAYLRPAIGKAAYWFWPPSLNIVPDGPGAYAVNRKPPPIQEIVDKGLFCQAVINLIRRVNGKVVPTHGDPRYDGGTLANQLFFKDFIRPFDRWAYYPRGTLIGRYYDDGHLAGGDQGHVGVLVQPQDLRNQRDGVLLHSHPAVGGLARTRLGASHAGWYYHYAILPQDWINHGRGAF